MTVPIIIMKTAKAKVVDYYNPQRNEIDSMKLWEEYEKHRDVETEDVTKPIGYAFNMLNKSPLMRQARKETGIKDLKIDETGNCEGVFHYQRKRTG